MPGDDGFRFHNDQGLGPTRPELAERNPKQPIEAVQFGTRLFPLPNSELLAKSSGLQSKFVARHEQGPDVSDHRASERNQQSDLIWLTGVSGQTDPVLSRLTLFLLRHFDDRHLPTNVLFALKIKFLAKI